MAESADGFISGAMSPLSSLKTLSSNRTASVGSAHTKSSGRNNLHMASGRSHPEVVKNAPLLRRTDFGDYYPDGGWGWVICGASFMVHFLCSGLHLASGVVMQQIQIQFKAPYIQAVLLVSAGYGGSLVLSPLVTALIRRRSLRLMAVVGALVLPLSALFMSFSKHLHQAFVCWSAILAAGSGFALTTSSAIVGRYFRKRRKVAEMLTLGGSGVGMAVMTVSQRHLQRALGWMRGWQALAAILLPAALASCLFRSASLYHPRRHAILHIRNMHKSKLAQQQFEDKPPYMDLSPLSMRSLQLIMASAGLSSLGTYTPFILLSCYLEREGTNSRSTTLLMVFMGVALAFGGLIVGLVEVRNSLRCVIVPQYFCQLSGLGCGIVTLLYVPATGFYAAAVYTWTFGLFYGAYAYSLKVHTCEQVTLKVFERAWGYVMCAQAIPTILGPTVAMMISELTDGGSRSGLVFAAASMIAGSLLLCFTSCAHRHSSNYHVIQTTHLRAKTRERDLAFLGMDISTLDDDQEHQPRRTRGPEKGWSDIEAMTPMSSTDKVTEFLLYTQSMLQTYSLTHHMKVPDVHLEINSEYGSDSEGSDGSHMTSEARAITALKLEATISRHPRRATTSQENSRAHHHHCCHHQRNRGSAEAQLTTLTGEVSVVASSNAPDSSITDSVSQKAACSHSDTAQQPKQCEMMTTV